MDHLTTTVSRAWFDEVWAIEVDTFRDDCATGNTSIDEQPDRHEFCLAMEAADTSRTRRTGRVRSRITITLNYVAAMYAAESSGALFVFDDVWKANGQHGFCRTSERVEREIADTWPHSKVADRLREDAAWERAFAEGRAISTRVSGQ